jgi:hypothetical protein
LQLSAERIGQAVAGGEQLAQIFQRVTEALGQPPSRRLGQRLRAWAQAGAQVRIQPLVVLETTDAPLMGRLRSRKLVRRHLTTVLSPTRSAIDPNHLPALVQTLRTLGLYTQAPPAVSAAPANTAGEDAVAAPYADTLWLLVQLYQGLGAVVELPVRLPDGLLAALRAQLTAPQQAAAASASERVLAQLEATLQGYLRLPAWQNFVQPPGLIATLETALAAGQDLQITYWGAGRDQKTVRRVTPYWLETREGALYLIAYCHLREAERVFRVDRIEACQPVRARREGQEEGRKGGQEAGRQ